MEEELKKIEELIDIEDIAPLKEHVLRFATQRLSKVEHVIVGMDPYPTKEKPLATGRAFEVCESNWETIGQQSSLRNIFKVVYLLSNVEKHRMPHVKKDFAEHNIYRTIYQLTSEEEERKNIKIDDVKTYFKNSKLDAPGEWFTKMEEQGILFLNATLTIPRNHDNRKNNPHAAHWAGFRELLIKHLQKKEITWHLWGKHAKDTVGEILKEELKKGTILESCHPRQGAFIYESTLYSSTIAKHIESVVKELAR